MKRTAIAIAVLMGATMVDADWKDEADARIEKHRKGDFAVTVVGADGKPLADAEVSVDLRRHHFLFGTCVGGDPSSDTLRNRKYFQFIADHFNAVVCENAMKWYATEKKRDEYTYDRADALMKFAEKHQLTMRGHCLFWSKPKFVQDWVKALPAEQLREEIDERLKRIVPRYKGRIACWDVNNEMLDGAFYRKKLGADIRAEMFKKAHALDPDAALFVNEYGILASDGKTDRYIKLIRDLRKRGAPVGGIGVQEHATERFRLTAEDLDDADLPERGVKAKLSPTPVLRRLDKLAELDLPIHLTEISSRTKDPQRRAETLEILFRVGFSHPSVEAIMLWGFWEKRHWLGEKAGLVDENWKLLPAGERVFGLLGKTWDTKLTARTDESGKLRFRGFYGTYHLSTGDRDAEVDLTPDSVTAEARLGGK